MSENLKSLREKGNALFHECQYEAAIGFYELALHEVGVTCETKAILHGNKAACFLKLKKYQDAIFESSTSLGFNSSYIKSLYRRCKAFQSVNRIQAAFDDAQSMVDISPDDKETLNVFNRLQLQLMVINSDPDPEVVFYHPLDRDVGYDLGKSFLVSADLLE